MCVRQYSLLGNRTGGRGFREDLERNDIILPIPEKFSARGIRDLHLQASVYFPITISCPYNQACIPEYSENIEESRASVNTSERGERGEWE